MHVMRNLELISLGLRPQTYQSACLRMIKNIKIHKSTSDASLVDSDLDFPLLYKYSLFRTFLHTNCQASVTILRGFLRKGFGATIRVTATITQYSKQVKLAVRANAC